MWPVNSRVRFLNKYIKIFINVNDYIYSDTANLDGREKNEMIIALAF